MRNSSAKQKGRRLEHKVAAVLGGKRAPGSGAFGGGDVWGTRFSIECKARKEIPALIRNAFGQAERDIAIGDARLPLVVIQADRSRPVACLYLQDLEALLGESGTSNAWHLRRVFDDIVKLAKNGKDLAG